MSDDPKKEAGYFAGFYRSIRKARDFFLGIFVPESYVRGTHLYSELEIKLTEAAYNEQRLHDYVFDLEHEKQDLIHEHSELEGDFAAKESHVEYLNSELGSIQGKIAEIVGEYRDLIKKHNVTCPHEIPDLEQLFEQTDGTITGLEFLKKLHTGKNHLILNLKSINAKERREKETLYQQFEEYRIKTIRQMESMESKDKLITILENVEDSFFLIDNQLQVEYISTATKGILSCDGGRLRFYQNKPFSSWFRDRNQYSEIESQIQRAKEQDLASFGPFAFKIPVYEASGKGYRMDEKSSRLVDINFVRTKDRKGYLVLIDKAKFFARLKESVSQFMNYAAPAKKSGEEGLAILPASP